jgi:integrase
MAGVEEPDLLARMTSFGPCQAITLICHAKNDRRSCWDLDISLQNWCPTSRMLAGRRRRRPSAPGNPFVGFRYHDLRHWFAVEALRGGMGIYKLSKHLGHSSVKTTEIYLSFLTGDEAERAKLA